jgi:DNA-binding LytR/AlgR family response regulator
MKKAEIQSNAEELIIFKKSYIYVFDFRDIIGFFCDHPYIKIETTTLKSTLIFHSLKEIAPLLPPQFVMCNRSAIINIAYIARLTSDSVRCVLHLKNGRIIRVARRKKTNITRKILSLLREEKTI